MEIYQKPTLTNAQCCGKMSSLLSLGTIVLDHRNPGNRGILDNLAEYIF